MKGAIVFLFKLISPATFLPLSLPSFFTLHKCLHAAIQLLVHEWILNFSSLFALFIVGRFQTHFAPLVLHNYQNICSTLHTWGAWADRRLWWRYNLLSQDWEVELGGGGGGGYKSARLIAAEAKIRQTVLKLCFISLSLKGQDRARWIIFSLLFRKIKFDRRSSLLHFNFNNWLRALHINKKKRKLYFSINLSFSINLFRELETGWGREKKLPSAMSKNFVFQAKLVFSKSAKNSTCRRNFLFRLPFQQFLLHWYICCRKY